MIDAGKNDGPVEDMHGVLRALAGGGVLSEAEARGVFGALLSGRLDGAQIGALLGLMQSRTVTAEELTGAARAMRGVVTRVPYEPEAGESLIDTCGTGGAPKLFNVSTAAALVAAAARPEAGSGVTRVVVAKHGNRSRTGRGSAEVLAALGVGVDASPEVQAACLGEAGVCFCFAIHHHPAMRHAAGPRKSLGMPTVFNLLGPLTNPAGAARQMLGVYDERFLEPMAWALARLGAEHAMVVHSVDEATGEGYDELTTLGMASVMVVRGGVVRRERIDPAALGLRRARAEELRADGVEAAAALLRAVLAGEHRGAARETTLLSAAGALVVAGAAGTVASGLAIAAEAVDSGRAMRTLERLARVSGGGV